MKARYFCTLFDSGYLLKGVAMLTSLAKNCPNAHVYVLCMDALTLSILSRMNLPFLTLIALQDLEDEALLEAKKDRGVAEYCWTLSPCLPWHVLQNNSEVEFITYLDADLLFYSPIQPLFDEIGDASIAIIEHRFSERLKDREINGRFCVEWVSFRRDEQGMACLSRWRDQCIDWCYYRLEESRMGDQKYLDEWPERYSACHILMHPGAGIAPWNYSQYCFDTDSQGQITIDKALLIFYHFHQFQLLTNGNFDRLSTFYTSEHKEPEAVYATYETALKGILQEIHHIVPDFSSGLKPVSEVSLRRWVQRFVPRKVKDFLHRFIRY
jgi:hypothetical protein